MAIQRRGKAHRAVKNDIKGGMMTTTASRSDSSNQAIGSRQEGPKHFPDLQKRNGRNLQERPGSRLLLRDLILNGGLLVLDRAERALRLTPAVCQDAASGAQ